jgi:hypothetical protein
MKLGFAIPIVGSAISSAAGLSAFCRGLEDLGYDTLWVGDRLVTPVDMHSTYPGKEQPYPPPGAAERQHAQDVLLRAAAPGPAADHARRAQQPPP